MRRSILFATLFGPFAVIAQPLNKPRLGLHPWATGLVQPVNISSAGDGRLFIAEKSGTVRIITDSMVVLERPFLDITDRVDNAGNEQGMLGMAFDPGYQENGYFYMYYIFGTNAGFSRISRFQVTSDPDSADASSEQVLYTWEQPEWNHNGGTIHFGPDGYLYMAFGDGGGGNDNYENAQDLTDPLGDIIRIDVSAHNDTFLIPPDNPFADQDGSDTLPEIWASGLRNPFRWSFDRATGDVWIGDVGQIDWEEVDFWPAGDNSGPNFGWRCREGFVTNYNVDQGPCGDSADYVSPIAAFDHLPGNQGWCSVMGGYVYRGTDWPHLYGQYIFTDYCAGDFITFAAGGMSDVDTLLMTTTAGFSGFGEDAAGELYVTNIQEGEVSKLVDACPMEDPVILEEDDHLIAPEGLSYQWLLGGIAIPDAMDQVYVPNISGNYQVVVDFGAPCALISDTVVFITAGVNERRRPVITFNPNPAKDEVHMNIASNVAVDRIELVDALGRVVFVRTFMAGAQRWTLDVSSLPSSTFAVRCLRNGETVAHERLIIAR